MERLVTMTAGLTLLAAGALPAQVTDGARFTPYGKGCGPTLTGTDTIYAGSSARHNLRFSVDNAFPKRQVVLLLGGEKTGVKLPGTACLLLNDAVASVDFMAGPDGKGSVALKAPGAIQGIVYAQAVPLDLVQPAIASSNGLEVLFTGTSPTRDPATWQQFRCVRWHTRAYNYGGDGVPRVKARIHWHPVASQGCSSSVPPLPNRPVVIFMHGNGMTNTDHSYLMRHLAGNGFVVASIENGGFMSGRNEGRARQAISFLNSMHRFWTFKSRLDDKVVFMGHSRGGEAAVTAARMLAKKPSMGFERYNVRAVVSIAPTDGGNDNLPDPKEHLDGKMTAAFLGIYGSHDPDVRGVRLEDPHTGANMPEETVFAIYDRAGVEGSSEGLLSSPPITKSTVFVHRATHEGFTDRCSPLDPLSCAHQRNVAKGYVHAFLRWHVLDQTAFRAYFTDGAIPASLKATGTELFTQYGAPVRRVVDNFEQGGSGTSTIGGSVTKSFGLTTLISENETWKLAKSSPHDTRGLRITWIDSILGNSVRWEIPNKNIPNVGRARDVSRYRYLSFRVAQVYKSWLNAKDKDKDFRVRLLTSSGLSGLVRVSDHGRIPYPAEAKLIPGLYPAGDYTKSAMNTVRIPLSAFSGANVKDVRRIDFVFDASRAGAILVDSLEFAN